MSINDKLNTLVSLFFAAVLFGALVFLLVRKLDSINRGRRERYFALEQERRQDYNMNFDARNDEMEYLLRDESKERVVNFPFVLTVIVFGLFITFLEFKTRNP